MQKITAKIASCLGLAAVVLLAPGNPAHADDKRAPDVVVFCDPTLEPALHKVGALWRSRTGVPVWIFAAPTDLLLAQVDRNARSDIVIPKARRHPPPPCNARRCSPNRGSLPGATDW